MTRPDHAMRRILHEPLLQFLLLGSALFAIAHAIDHRRDTTQRRIVIDAAQVEYQRNIYRAQFGAWPDAMALESLIQARIRDEALYREALRLGLDQDDGIIRQRLVQKMEFVLTDAVTPPEPDDAALHSYLEAHPERYMEPGRVSFQLLYFATEAGSAQAQERASRALRRLEAGESIQGDPFALGEQFTLLDAVELTRRFGESPMAGAPFTAPVGQWSGPFASGYGWHLIRVSMREPAQPADFAVLRERLHDDWQADFRDRDLEMRIDSLLAQHEVLRLDRPAPAR